MKAASDEKDLDDFRVAFKKYIKATPDCTYPQLEMAFRGQRFNIYLIALEKELAATFTNMDLQGNLDKKYTVSFRLSPKHQRPKEKDLWPETPEENLARLQDAGEPVDRGIPKCSNCEQLGHISKSCPEEKVENADRAQVKCYNCEEVGHRVRDCRSSPLSSLIHILTLLQAPTLVLTSLLAVTASSQVIPARNALSHALLRELSARSAMRVSSPCTIMITNLLIKVQLVISLRIVHKAVVAVVPVTIVVRRVTESKTARTQPRPCAGTVMLRDILAKSAPSLVTTLALSALTASRWVIRRFVARNRLSMRTQVLVSHIPTHFKTMLLTSLVGAAGFGGGFGANAGGADAAADNFGGGNVEDFPLPAPPGDSWGGGSTAITTDGW